MWLCFRVSFSYRLCSPQPQTYLFAVISNSSAKSAGGCSCPAGKCQCLDCKSCVKKPVTIARI